MIRTVIFDLSEVLIAGLVGIEGPLALQLRVPEDALLRAFGGKLLEDLCRGTISEGSYLAQIIERQGWDVSVSTLKRIIRQNLRQCVPGMEEILVRLAPKYELVLLSDHAAEWVAYIRSIHPFLEVFAVQVFSFEIGQLKSEPSTSQWLLEAIGREPEECLFVDDNPRNVRAASAVGIAGIQFRNAQALKKSLAAYGL
jgi:HAD superfamily hydrolase (TIGR01509 family)